MTGKRAFAINSTGKTLTTFDEDAWRIFDTSFVPKGEPVTKYLPQILAGEPIQVIRSQSIPRIPLQ